MLLACLSSPEPLREAVSQNLGGWWTCAKPGKQQNTRTAVSAKRQANVLTGQGHQRARHPVPRHTMVILTFHQNVFNPLYFIGGTQQFGLSWTPGEPAARVKCLAPVRSAKFSAMEDLDPTRNQAFGPCCLKSTRMPQ